MDTIIEICDLIPKQESDFQMKRAFIEFVKSLMKMMIDTTYEMSLEKISSQMATLWTL
jgi:hypothetical protein